jgi:hypothetical protein
LRRRACSATRARRATASVRGRSKNDTKILGVKTTKREDQSYPLLYAFPTTGPLGGERPARSLSAHCSWCATPAALCCPSCTPVFTSSSQQQTNRTCRQDEVRLSRRGEAHFCGEAGYSCGSSAHRSLCSVPLCVCQHFSPHPSNSKASTSCPACRQGCRSSSFGQDHARRHRT